MFSKHSYSPLTLSLIHLSFDLLPLILLFSHFSASPSLSSRIFTLLHLINQFPSPFLGNVPCSSLLPLPLSSFHLSEPHLFTLSLLHYSTFSSLHLHNFLRTSSLNPSFPARLPYNITVLLFSHTLPGIFLFPVSPSSYYLPSEPLTYTYFFLLPVIE